MVWFFLCRFPFRAKPERGIAGSSLESVGLLRL